MMFKFSHCLANKGRVMNSYFIVKQISQDGRVLILSCFMTSQKLVSDHCKSTFSIVKTDICIYFILILAVQSHSFSVLCVFFHKSHCFHRNATIQVFADGSVTVNIQIPSSDAVSEQFDLQSLVEDMKILMCSKTVKV